MTPAVIAFAISLILIVLGFVALLTEKIYLDPATRKPIAVELPLVGKLKSNYPAHVFVFLGFALAFYTFSKSYERPKKEWIVRGSFKSPSNQRIDWSRGTITLIPSDLSMSISEKGSFEIRAHIEEGKKLEDVYRDLDFSIPQGSTQIPLKTEFRKYEKGEASRIVHATDHTRTYEPLEIDLYPEPP